MGIQIEGSLLPVGSDKEFSLFVSILVAGPEAEGPVLFDADIYLSLNEELITGEFVKVTLNIIIYLLTESL